jgi:subtilisin family serine protease
MKIAQVIILTFVAFFLIPSPLYSIYPGADTTSSNSHIYNRLIVKINPEMNLKPVRLKGSTASIGLSRFDEISSRYEIKYQEALFANLPTHKKPDPMKNTYIIQIPVNANISELIAEYEKIPEVEYVHPDYQMQLYETPNDPLYNHQWALNNTGQGYYHVDRGAGQLIIQQGSVDADIDAQEVYDNPPDNTRTVIVAIIDTGVDMDHPDLAGRIWTNPREIAGNNFDDDHNGYIDDVYGWDFTNDTLIFPPAGDNDPTDTYGHGTHCAGIIAAVTNNNEGIAGICHDCEIMPVKFYPVMLSSFAAKSIIYATDNGADVISMSFGYPWPVQILQDAIDYARSKGVILCAASGNDEDEHLNYPAACNGVITVGATNSDDEVTHFSTYGNHLNVSAPGLSILSLRADDTDMYEGTHGYQTHIIEEIFYLASGTSMACPHVAGAAALLCAISPGLNPDKAQEILQISADDIIDPYNDGQYLPGWDKYSGHGRLNLLNAISIAPSVRARIESPYPNEIISGQVFIFGAADGNDFESYVLEFGTESSPNVWNQIDSSASPITDGLLGVWDIGNLSGRHTIRMRVGDFNISIVDVFIVNSQLAVIDKPLNNDTVATWTAIHGSASCPDFDQYVVEYNLESDPSSWTEIWRSTIPIVDDELAIWSTSELEDDVYNLRLLVWANSVLVLADTISVQVLSLFNNEDGWKVSFSEDITNVPNYGDFNNDGINEIVVGTDNGLRFFSPDGTPIKTVFSEMQGIDFRIPIAVGNLDGDGIDDYAGLGVTGSAGVLYAVRSRDSSFIQILPSAPDNLRIGEIDETLYPFIYLKDINGDGLDEIHCNYSRKLTMTPDLYYSYTSDGVFLMQFPEHDFGNQNFVKYLPVDLDGNGVDEYYLSGFKLTQADYQGNITGSFSLEISAGINFATRSLSAVDMDSDGKLELVIFGYQDKPSGTYWTFVFDENLTLKPGWPQDSKISSFLVPPGPVFADIDNDGDMEYFISFFELAQGQVFAWNTDGSSFGGETSSAIFAGTPQPGMMASSVMADLNGDNYPDIIANVKQDIYQSYKIDRLVGWDHHGELLEGWPIIYVSAAQRRLNSGNHTPVIGDIDKDGYTDILMTTSTNELIFLNFDEAPYDSNNCRIPFWRYNRSMNNICLFSADSIQTNVDDIDINEYSPIPESFNLANNYPNPFNTSTKIKFSIPEISEVEFSVYNILGQIIEHKNLGKFEPGIYTITWSDRRTDNTELPSGLYFYRIKTNKHSQTRKMVLLK